MDYTGLWDRLKANGWTTYKIRQEGLLGQNTLAVIRAGKPINGVTISTLCEVLQCQPGDLMRYVSDAEEAMENKE